VTYYVPLKAMIDDWFKKNAKALGGASSHIYTELRKKYDVQPVHHGNHNDILGKNDKLLDAINALPATPTAAPQQTAPANPQPGTLQPKTDGAAATANDAGMAMVDSVLRSPGQGLDSSALEFFGSRFEQDFSNVRVHTDEQAAKSARGINALAYTVGSDIVFGAGAFAPNSERGRRLLAHELTHVVQQTGPSPRAAATVQRSVATEEDLHPIRADEKDKVLPSFTFGRFSIFVPEKVTFGNRTDEIPNLKVHVFFSASRVAGDIRDDVLTHGLHGASNQSDWVLIGVPAHTTISDQEIVDCLASIGIHDPIRALRLSGHSRGAFSLMNSVVQKTITTLSLIDRVTLLDADDNPDTTDPDRATKTPKVEILKNAGIPVSKIVAYEVNVHKRHIRGATYIGLDSGSMAAIGYVRLIQDAMVTQPGISSAVAANADIKSQLESLPLPPRGNFTTKAPDANHTSLQTFAQQHRAEIQAILSVDGTRNGLLFFINQNNLARFEGYKFDRAVSAHHFFAAEVAHELVE
jgi:hypothetical protein